MPERQLRQRSDLTHKHNLTSGRHGWLRLTPAYSVKLVSRILENYETPVRVLDPFSGTGTTALAAAEQGHSATGVDVNPFLVWLGNAKLAFYTKADIQHAVEAVSHICTVKGTSPAEPPPIHNIERWWHPEILAVLCDIKGRIDALKTKVIRVRDLLLIAFCQTVIKLSNAAFNHQSMSFAGRKAELAHAPGRCIECFQTNAVAVIESLVPDLEGHGDVILGDSRQAPPGGEYDVLITSPPYPNRMSYIRELRPYMYWLGYIREAREAGELDWNAIGGTWGIATSRLSDWKPDPGVTLPPRLYEVVEEIAQANGANGRLLSAYVHKYFFDMWAHFKTAKDSLKRGGKAVYIVGNSTFYGVTVPAERIYADMLGAAGFINVRVEPIRKRNSKKELFEYAVEADCAAPSLVGTVAAVPQIRTPTLF
jgi:SAM-dependent methyltransferase